MEIVSVIYLRAICIARVHWPGGQWLQQLANKWTTPNSMHRNAVKSLISSTNARIALCSEARIGTTSWLLISIPAPTIPATSDIRLYQISHRLPSTKNEKKKSKSSTIDFNTTKSFKFHRVETMNLRDSIRRAQYEIQRTVSRWTLTRSSQILWPAVV